MDLGCKCGWHKMRSKRYKSLQSEYGPLKMLKVPISEIIGKMEAVPEETERKCCSEGYRYHEIPTSKETFQARLEAMEKKASICLDQVHGKDVPLHTS